VRGVQWGWRVQCCHEGCSRTVEGWSDAGYPSLPWPGAYAGGPLAGWVIWYRDGYNFRPASYRKGHVSFCPEHAAVAKDWMSRFSAWSGERHKVGKEAAAAVKLSLQDRLAEWLSPAAERSKQNRAVGEVAREWERTHPAPVPPWRT
jgi:hypothetical protein